MKKYFLLFFIFGALISCDKDDNDPGSPTDPSCPPAPLATFRYKSNGNLFEFTGSLLENSKEGVLIRKGQITPNDWDGTELTNTKYGYWLFATKNYYHGEHGGYLVAIQINTTTLTEKTYTQTANDFGNISFYIQNITNDGEPPGTNFTFSISKIENGYASGTFQGKLYNYSQYPNRTFYDIAEGKFSNVKILQ